MYTIENLIKENLSYHCQHVVTSYDVEKVNKLIEMIESSRSTEFPLPGDIVRYTSKYGDYYEKAHIEKVNQEECYICEKPYIPFVELTKANKISTNTSGGAWNFIPTNLKYVGKSKKYFKTWGHCGSCANGAVVFMAEVSVWEYTEGKHEFTTKDFDKFYLYISQTDEGVNKYLLSKEGSSYAVFDTEEEYKAWKNTFHGVEKEGYHPNQRIVWTYKQEKQFVPLNKYLTIKNATIDSELINGCIQECKRIIDGTKITTIFPLQHEKIILEGEKPYKNYYLSKEEKTEGDLK